MVTYRSRQRITTGVLAVLPVHRVDDRGLYNTGQKWLNKQHVIGRARGYLPYVGMVTIIMNDYPMFKCAFPAPLCQVDYQSMTESSATAAIVAQQTDLWAF